MFLELSSSLDMSLVQTAEVGLVAITTKMLNLQKKKVYIKKISEAIRWMKLNLSRNDNNKILQKYVFFFTIVACVLSSLWQLT